MAKKTVRERQEVLSAYLAEVVAICVERARQLLLAAPPASAPGVDFDGYNSDDDQKSVASEYTTASGRAVALEINAALGEESEDLAILARLPAPLSTFLNVPVHVRCC